MIRLLAIARNTFVQTLRQPVCIVIIAAAFFVLVLSVGLSGWTMGRGAADFQETDQKMLQSVGIGTLLIAGLLIAVFSASSAVNREIEDNTALTVLSKPVSRATFVLGKFAGVAGAVAVAYYLCSLVYLMTVRHEVMSVGSDPYDVPVLVLGISAFVITILVATLGNYFFGWTFISTAVLAGVVFFSAAMGVLSFVGKEWHIVPFGHDLPTRLAISSQLIIGLCLTFLAVLVLTAVAVAASTRLGQISTLLICVATFLLGSIHPTLFPKDIVDKYFALRIASWAVPQFTVFYPVDAIMGDKQIPLSYLGLAGAYAAIYAGAAMAFGISIFQHRQIAVDTESSGGVPGAITLIAWVGRAAGAVIGITALAALTMPENRTIVRAAHCCVGLLAGSAMWLLWTFFARGAKWSYWLVLLLCAAVMACAAAGLTVSSAAEKLNFAAGPVRLTVAAVLSALLLVILALPKTRRHFATS